MPWGDPGVTEQVLIQETAIAFPSTSASVGGNAVRTLQRAGLLKKLSFWFNSVVTQTAATTAPVKSPFGGLGGGINRIRVEANGQLPLYDLSGLGAMLYNEVCNRDGSVLAPPLNIAELSVADSLRLAQYDAPATGALAYTVNFPFEFPFALPVNIRQQVTELGLYLLQNQAIDVGISVTFNPQIAAAAAINDALYSGGVALAASAPTAANQLQIERELYNIPNDPKDNPVLSWAHQVIEFTVPFTGSFSRFAIPRAGLLLRAIIHTVDAAAQPAAVEYTDITALKWVYGSNETPISRPGWALAKEYLQDYNRQPPKGAVVLDFYKWGWEGLKLVKNTEELSNLRIETTYAATTAGTQRIILDRLIPVVRRAG